MSYNRVIRIHCTCKKKINFLPWLGLFREVYFMYILQFHPQNKWTTLSNTGKTCYGYSTFLETYRGVSFRLNRAVKSFQLPISKVQLLYFFYTYDLLLQLLKVRFDMSFAAFMVCSMFQYLWLGHKICRYQSCKH